MSKCILGIIKAAVVSYNLAPSANYLPHKLVLGEFCFHPMTSSFFHCS